MTQIKNPITVVKSGGGGTINIVNGIVDSFKANSSTIDANTFVNFINKTTNSDFRSTDITSSRFISAVALASDKVFVAYQDSNRYTKAIIYTISGTTITAGTSVQIFSSQGNGNYGGVKAILNSENKVVVARQGSSSFTATVCTISGTTITAGTQGSVNHTSSLSSTYDVFSMVKIEEDKFCVVYPSSGKKLYCSVFTINGTTISGGTAATEAEIGGSGVVTAKGFLTSTNKICCVCISEDGKLYGTVCTISGTTITAGSLTVLDDTHSYYTPSRAFGAVALGNNKGVVCAYSEAATNTFGDMPKVVALACSINGTTITVGEVEEIALGAKNYISSPVALDGRTVALAVDIDNRLYVAILTVVGKTIIKNINVIEYRSGLVPFYASLVLLSANKIVIAFSNSSSNQYLTLCSISDTSVMVAKSTNGIGLTKTSCSTSTAGDVWLLGTT